MWGTCKYLSTGCFWAGFVSIAASIAIWFLFKGDDPAHGERFGNLCGALGTDVFCAFQPL